ncbi:MAG: hypothetical protein QM813_08665 [Verrucomicrobiota bacterium]
MKRRFGRGFPLAFLILTALAFLGGALYGPANYDGLAYRTPRVLHWLAADQWHWIHADFPRLNNRAVGYEWMTAPLYALTGSDRLQFLINIVSFALLPGLIFSLFTRLGLRPRLAWSWMWLLPTGYCLVLQAGSIANDLFAVPFALAAVDLALRARAKNSGRDLLLSVLAVGMLAGSKASNLPLGLPWFLAAVPAVGLLWRHRVATIAIGVVAFVCSYAPMALVNIKQCGDWSGQKLEEAAAGGVPVLRFGVNTILLTLENFVPPVFPVAGAYNAWMTKHLPAQWTEVVGAKFEGGAARLNLGELRVEEQAGLGLGVSGLLLIGTVAGFRLMRRQQGLWVQLRTINWWNVILLLSPFVGLGIFMLKSGLSGLPRLVAPYSSHVCPRAVMSGSAVAHRATPVVALVGRPQFFSGGSVVGFVSDPTAVAGDDFAAGRGRGRIEAPPRATGLDGLLGLQPADGCFCRRARGTAGGGESIGPSDAGRSGNLPLAAIRFATNPACHSGETAAQVRARGLRYVLVTTERFSARFQKTFVEWLSEMDGEVLATWSLKLRAGQPAVDWHLVKLRDAEIPATPQKARPAP